MRAINQAGLVSEPVASDGFTVDPTHPQGGWIYDGDIIGYDQLFSASSTSFTAQWGGFNDTEDGIVRYEIGIGECAAPIASIVLFNVSHTPTHHTFELATDSSGVCTYMPSSPTCTFNQCVRSRLSTPRPV